MFNCLKHGHEHIVWKCHLCCSEALYRCGNRYTCEDCHSWGWLEDHNRDCVGGANCPLGVPHPKASQDPIKGMYPLGCSLCRQTDKIAGEHKNVSEIKLDKSNGPDYKVDYRFVNYNPLEKKLEFKYRMVDPERPHVLYLQEKRVKMYSTDPALDEDKKKKMAEAEKHRQ